MPTVRFERVDPRQNISRFYEIALAPPDLFGRCRVHRHWGRIGTESVWATTDHLDEAEAQACFRRHVAKRVRNGYVLVSDQDGLLADMPAVPRSGRQRLLAIVDELEILSRRTASGETGSLGSIIASLGSVVRHASPEARPIPGDQGQVASWPVDDVDERVRTRVTALLDALVSEVIGPEEAAGITRRLQHGGTMAAAVVVVPRTKHALLDRALLEMFADDRRLDALAQRLHRQDVRFLGQLVQMPFAAVLREAGGDRRVIDALQARLDRLGLRLGSVAPRWSPPGLTRRRAG
jgi:predicted DNA-binding WGR domain protein